MFHPFPYNQATANDTYFGSSGIEELGDIVRLTADDRSFAVAIRYEVRRCNFVS